MLKQHTLVNFNTFHCTKKPGFWSREGGLWNCFSALRQSTVMEITRTHKAVIQTSKCMIITMCLVGLAQHFIPLEFGK